MARFPAFDPEVREALSRTWQGRCWRCGGVGSDYAHRRPRGVRDAHTACFCNATWLCRVCHRWSHNNPVASLELGITVSRYEAEPFTIPITLLTGRFILGCNRTVTPLGND